LCHKERTKRQPQNDAVRILSLILGKLLLLAGLATNEECRYPRHLECEEVNHRDVVTKLEPCKFTKEVLIPTGPDEQEANCMREAGPELRDLPHSEVALQGVPQTKACDQVVRVHQDVRDGVDECAVADSAVAMADTEQVAPNYADCGVVVNVQKRKLLRRVLLEDDEERVAPVQPLGKIVAKNKPLTCLGV